MIQEFDYFGHQESPTLVLCNPDKTQLVSLGSVYDRKLSQRFNALSELTFCAPYMIDGVPTPYYDLLEYRRLIYVENFGYYMITGVETNDDGIVKEKLITCNSLEVEMATKKVTGLKGTFKFYDVIPTSGSPALLNTLLGYLPGWSAGSIDADIALLYRTFDVSDSTIYNLLMEDISNAYQCIFTFDTINQLINVYSTSNATTATDIYMSFNNLIEKINIKEITDEIVTALTVKGAGNLSINQVNPLGSDTIYNFDYYKNVNWMSQGLIDAIDAWELLISNNQATYAGLLTELETYNSTLITQQGTLVTLDGEYKSLENIKFAQAQQGIDLTSINAQLAAKQIEINNATTAISQTQTLITNVTAQLVAINELVCFDCNFTPTQLIELDKFIIGSTYQNNNFVETDIMTYPEIQAQAQDLYDQAINVLTKVSTPRYEFSMDAVNFTALPEYQIFIDQVELGCVITLDLDGGLNLFESNYVHTSGSSILIYPVLLGMDINFDDPTDFSLIFSNRLRLDNSSFQLTDLFGETNKAGISTSFNSEQWSSWNNNYKDSVSTFITSSLDATLNNIISGSGQDVLINQTGIRIRKSTGLNTYDPQQIWMNQGVIAFTDNNWDSVKMALGNVTTGSTTNYGLVAEVVTGRLLAGNNLTITNENNTFTVDGAGATLTNATLTINSSTGNGRMFLDPTNGIKIQKNVGGTWTDQMSMDTSGNLTFAGVLKGATGTFSGTLSAATITGATINGGTINGATGYFSGNIYAANLQGQVSDGQIQSVSWNKVTAVSIDAGTITAGYLSANRISGGTLYSPYISGGTISGGYISGGTINGATLSGVYIGANTITTGNINVLGTTSLGGTTYVSGVLSITGSGSIYAGGSSGKSPAIYYRKGGDTSNGYLYFTDGILTGYS
jgi:hypothetical protein